MHSWILFDNQSSVTIFGDLHYWTDIKKTDDQLDLQTNAGIMSTNMKCNIPEWGKA
jgi:hypothetical protein